MLDCSSNSSSGIWCRELRNIAVSKMKQACRHINDALKPDVASNVYKTTPEVTTPFNYSNVLAILTVFPSPGVFASSCSPVSFSK